MVPIIRHTQETINKKYPEPWTVLTGVGWKIIRKHFGSFIASAACFPGHPVRYTVKVRDVTKVSTKPGTHEVFLIQTYKKIGAGAAINLIEAQLHIEKNIIPINETIRDSANALKAEMKPQPSHIGEIYGLE